MGCLNPLSIRGRDGPPCALLAGEDDIGIGPVVVGPLQLAILDIAPLTEVPRQNVANLLPVETVPVVNDADMDTARHAAAARTVAGIERDISITDLHKPVPAVAGASGINSGTSAIADSPVVIG
jgi:predicted nucleic acid-binding protein